jgi:hypothetical protein
MQEESQEKNETRHVFNEHLPVNEQQCSRKLFFFFCRGRKSCLVVCNEGNLVVCHDWCDVVTHDFCEETRTILERILVKEPSSVYSRSPDITFDNHNLLTRVFVIITPRRSLCTTSSHVDHNDY